MTYRRSHLEFEKLQITFTLSDHTSSAKRYNFERMMYGCSSTWTQAAITCSTHQHQRNTNPTRLPFAMHTATTPIESGKTGPARTTAACMPYALYNTKHFFVAAKVYNRRQTGMRLHYKQFSHSGRIPGHNARCTLVTDAASGYDEKMSSPNDLPLGVELVGMV